MISIIIPVLNEETGILRLIDHLKKTSCFPENQIIIVDGGSIDKTVAIVKDLPGTTFITSEKGRAKQMNKGAQIAKFDVLYFLHADSYPPENFDALILEEIKNGRDAGCFQMKFDLDRCLDRNIISQLE